MKNIKLNSVLIAGIIVIFSVFLISTLSLVIAPNKVSGADCPTYPDETTCVSDSACLWVFIPELGKAYCRTLPEDPPPLDPPDTYGGTVTINEDTLHYVNNPAFIGKMCVCRKDYYEDDNTYTPSTCNILKYSYDGVSAKNNGTPIEYQAGTYWPPGFWGLASENEAPNCSLWDNPSLELNSYKIEMFRYLSVEGLTPGPHTINFYTECSGDCGQGVREWSKSFTIPDTTPVNGDPDVDLVAPAHDVWINYTPTFSAKAWDPDYPDENARAYISVTSTPAVAGYGQWVDDQHTPSAYTPATLADGQWWWKAYTEDDEGAWSGWSSNWLVKKDTVNPTASLDQENGISTDDQIWVNLTETDDRSGIAEGDVDIRINSGEWQDYASTIDDFIYTAGGSLSSTQGPNSPTAGASATPGDVSWTNPTNIIGNDNSYTEAQLESSLGDDYSESLNATSYGFSIPTDATISGIEVEVDRKSATDVVGSSASVTKNVGTANTSGGYGVGWNSNTFNRGTASDNWRIASDQMSQVAGEDMTEYLKATNFGFAIPSDATIDGVLVQIEKGSAVGARLNDWEIKLIKAGIVQEENKANIGVYWPNINNEVYFSYGGAADLWNETLTPADINASNFGVTVRVIIDDSDFATAYLDHIKMTVYYTTVDSRGVSDYNVKLIKNGVAQGNDKAILGTSWPTTEATQIYGGPTDLWGSAWTPAEINASNFGATIKAVDEDNPGIGYVDHIRTKVYYTAPINIEGDTFEFRYRVKDNAGNWSDFAYDGMVTIAFSDKPTAACIDDEVWAYCTDSLNPFLSWDYSDPDSDPQESYQLQVDNKADFSSPLIDTGEVFSSSGTYHPSGATLNFTTAYYWRIKAKDDNDNWSDWSDPTCSFTTPDHAYPDVDFSWAPIPATTREMTQFVDETNFSGPAINHAWSWTFESAVPATSILQNPIVSFSATGDWDVTLQATDDSGYTCSDTQSVNVELPLPTWKEVKP